SGDGKSSRENGGGTKAAAVEEASGERRDDEAKQVHAKDAAERGGTETEGRGGEIEIHVSECADQGKEHAESHGEGREKTGVAEVQADIAEDMANAGGGNEVLCLRQPLTNRERAEEIDDPD